MEDAQLEARIQSFELAYRMQIDATDAFDITREPEYIRNMYGDRRPGPPAPDCTASHRKGRAFCSSLARRRPALG